MHAPASFWRLNRFASSRHWSHKVGSFPTRRRRHKHTHQSPQRSRAPLRRKNDPAVHELDVKVLGRLISPRSNIARILLADALRRATTPLGLVGPPRAAKSTE